MKPEFKAYLGGLKEARKETNAFLRVFIPTQKKAGKALGAAWEASYDYICRFKKRQLEAQNSTGTPKDEIKELEELTKITGVIYKLAQSTQQMKSTEHSARDFEEKNMKFRDLALRALQENPGLPPELRAKLEHDFDLLG